VRSPIAWALAVTAHLRSELAADLDAIREHASQPRPRPPFEPTAVVVAAIADLDDADLVAACKQPGVEQRARLADQLPGTPPVFIICEASNEAHGRGLIDDAERRDVRAMAPYLTTRTNR
jgi:hypothetical protein